MNQTKAANHIREALIERGFDIPSRRMTVCDNQQWLVFERRGRQVGVDQSSGIWLRESKSSEWRSEGEHTTSGTFMAVDFLTKG